MLYPTQNFFMAGLFTYAVCYVLMESEIFQRPRAAICRNLHFMDALFSCYFCCGFWVAALSMIWLNRCFVDPALLDQYPHASRLVDFFMALFCGAVSHAVSTVLWFLQALAGQGVSED